MLINLRYITEKSIVAEDFLNTESNIKISSLKISELTGKKHHHVKRDIKNMLTILYPGVARFGYTYFDKQNKKQEGYILPRTETLCLISGYSIPLRKAIIDRIDELENKTLLNKLINNITLLDQQIKSNGSEWGKMGVDQRKAKTIQRSLNKGIEKIIQPCLSLSRGK